ncbi:MAG: response regulator [Fermentimonas sp.]|nr:response regulator [Fermentimonas sp.]
MREGFQNTHYIVIILLLAISASLLLYAYLERTRRIRILKNVEQIRSNIFTKITHEFRTPLTIIMGLSRQLREQKDISNNNAETYLNAIERQGKNLSELVNQLLDISSLKTAPKALEWKTGNIVAFVNMISETFRIYAKQKDIDLFFFSEESEIETDFVPDYLNKIMHNLLGNAIKFSEEGTRIYVLMERDKKNDKKLIIKVIDHGKGISKEALPHIFELFYQNEENGEMIGNGIGLTLTKQLVEIVGGTINVESDTESGTTFVMEFPLNISEKILYPRWTNEKNGKQITAPVNNGDTAHLFSTEIKEDDPRITMLLVEDNKDIALYIRSIFPSDTYNIIYTSNGESALELANEHIPDIIITDVIMPKKNGIELCREIKSSTVLNHIPVIMISAKNSDKDVAEGYKNGADGYIKKPFHPEELKIRVNNILETRERMKAKYYRSVIKEDKKENDIKNDNVNIEFLRHATDIIYREMKNPNFTPLKLAQELAISVSQLNKKLNAITGYPSSSYILQVKLSHAKKLLASQNTTIGEVATECGIFDLNYFSRAFKKQTGLTPTQFRKLPDVKSNI